MNGQVEDDVEAQNAKRATEESDEGVDVLDDDSGKAPLPENPTVANGKTAAKQSASLRRRQSRKTLQQAGPQTKYSVAWRNLRFSVGKKTIIQECTGLVRPGELLSILGPSGCGKTTLLSILAHRTKEYGRKARLEGEVLFNGKVASRRERRDFVSLVPQDAALFGDFTVDETMWFQARLYFGWKNYSWDQLYEKITATLTSLGIESCRSVKVGSLLFKGLSGGQKRRLSIAVEILSSPAVLLLDEPTTGLDSATSLGILQLLKQLAQFGHTVVATIHQPSSQMWIAMTDVMIMSRGYVVFSGPASESSQYFSDLSLICPKRFNPCEFFLGIVTSDFDVPVFKHQYTIEGLHDTFVQKSSQFKRTKDSLEAEIGQEGKPKMAKRMSSLLFTGPKSAKQVTFFSQFVTLMIRNLNNYKANLAIFVLRFIAFAFLGVVTGLVFLDAGQIQGDPGVTASVMALLAGLVFFSFMSMAVIPFIIEDRLVFQRELRNGAYHKFPLILSLILISLLSTAIMAIMVSVLTIFMCQLSIGVGLHFLIVWAVLFYAEILVLTVGAIFRHYIVGIALATSWFAMGMITAGPFVQLPTMTWVIRWQSLVNPLFWSSKAMFSVEFPRTLVIDGGLLFPTGQAVWDYFHVDLHDITGFWASWGCLVALVAGYVLLFILAVMVLW